MKKAFWILLFGVVGNVFAEDPTDWMSEARVGVFTHYLPGNPEQFANLSQYDPEAVAEQMASLGVKYFVFTIFQNSGYMNAPNAEYCRVTGYAAGEKCSTRDVPMELADALSRRGIRLVLYVTGQCPNRDARAQKAFGLNPGPKDQKLDVAFAQKWAKVLQEWSDRYGTKVSGWWMDGCYQWVDFNEEIAAIYAGALKHGNPDAMVAFNPGVRRAEWKTSDYTAGEINEPFAETATSRFNAAGQQTQILTFLGTSWARPDERFTDVQWVDWIRGITNVGGAVTLDARPETNGTLNDAQFRQLKAITEQILTEK
ncbi:MAG: alpha-L-fucosidase [Planctomycetia bacterium]|nr:alpha-L-fucosidase [Planctomycetia bacterium]